MPGIPDGRIRRLFSHKFMACDDELCLSMRTSASLKIMASQDLLGETGHFAIPVLSESPGIAQNLSRLWNCQV